MTTKSFRLKRRAGMASFPESATRIGLLHADDQRRLGKYTVNGLAQGKEADNAANENKGGLFLVAFSGLDVRMYYVRPKVRIKHKSI